MIWTVAVRPMIPVILSSIRSSGHPARKVMGGARGRVFIVVFGGLADRVGRVKILMWGFTLGVVGSVLVGSAPPGPLAAPLLMLGRISQDLSGALIMPASLALIKTYWDGAGRQRAVSLWSMGSWGGSGFAALFGGLWRRTLGGVGFSLAPRRYRRPAC